MSEVADPLLVVVLLLNFLLLGTSNLRALIQTSAVQGIVLGVLTLLVQVSLRAETVLIATVAVLLKGMLIPWMLNRAMRNVAIRREVEPFIGYIPSLLLGGMGTGLAIVFAHTLPLAPQHTGSLLVPAALSTVLTGFLLLTTRRKAITQAVGYLILENGVFIMGLTLVEAMPFLVEVGVLLDLFVGIFVMGIVIYHISREFSNVDTPDLTTLRD